MASNIEVRIVVAEDEDLIRNSLVRKIEAMDPALKVVGTAEDGREALALVEREQPDLVFTDIRMPVMDGMELIRSLHLYFPRVRKVITSGYADFDYARQGIQYQVQEYLLKPISSPELQRVLVRMKSAVAAEHSQMEDSMKELRQPGVNPEEIVLLVQQYIREQFSKDLSLELIARHFNFNASYLSKLFAKYTGEPPSRYLMTVRVNEAKYLLTRHPQMSVKEVGERVGYPDPFYFSRIFKQMTGFTPKEYR